MLYLKSVLIPIGLVALHLTGIQGSPYTISDDRIRSLDITPVLGRGYSIMTNQFHSTCLMVDETTTPSYNYEYKITDLTRSTDYERELEGSLSSSFGYFWVKSQVDYQYKSSTKVETKTHMVVATMRIERYYSSVREEASPLSDSAKEILARQDYVGFFKACGPNYVRGIRRAQEVTAIFSFKSATVELASQFAVQLNRAGWFRGKSSYEFASKAKYASINESLSINILGFGLGLNQEGSQTLVATSLEEYNDAIKFAFKSFTQNEESHEIGMVYGIEVVPWVNNAEFQVSAVLQDDFIQLPLPAQLIQKADVDGNCKDETYEKDKFNKCCESGQLYNPATADYDFEDGDDPLTYVCRPIRNLDGALVKDNISTNGEFVARLDTALRYRHNQLSTLARCIQYINAIPDRFRWNVLKPGDSVKYDKAIEFSVSVEELKRFIDPMGDFKLLKNIGKEMDEWIQMYYVPCLAALFGSNIGTLPDVEPQYFMAYPWYTHDECMHLTCLSENMRWDRDNGGCVPGLNYGPAGASGYDDNADEECYKEYDERTDTEECKYSATELQDDLSGMDECWDEVIVQDGVKGQSADYLVDHFCMPEITGYKIDQATIDTMEAALASPTGKCNSTSRRRKLASARTLKKDDVDVLKMEDVDMRAGDSGVGSITNLKKRVVDKESSLD